MATPETLTPAQAAHIKVCIGVEKARLLDDRSDVETILKACKNIAEYQARLDAAVVSA